MSARDFYNGYLSGGHNQGIRFQSLDNDLEEIERKTRDGSRPIPTVSQRRTVS